MTRAPVRFVRGIFVLAAIGLLATCQNETVGPGRRVALAVAPVLSSSTRLAAFNLTIDGARLIVVSPPADTAFDRTYPFPANQTSLQVEADISLDQSPQTFAVTIQLLSGSTVLFAGTQNVTLSSGSSTPSTQIPVTYTGPGQTVASLTIGPPDSVLSFGAAMTFRATALDGQGAPVPNFYVSWTTSDTVAVPIDATGHLVAPSVRRSVTVTAQTPNDVVASTAITFAPVATTLAIASGCGQSGLLGSQLPQPIVAKVTASDGLGVPGVVVSFSAPAGASVATPQVTTDAGGLAQTLVTLGATSGPAAFQASAPGLTTVPCNQSAFGAATQLVFLTQPSATFAGNVIAPPVVVEARDAQGTPVPTFTGNVSVALGNNPGGATLSGTTTVLAVGGQASFDDLSLDKVGAGYTLAFTATGLATATSAPFAISGGSPDHLVFTIPPVNTPSGTAITPAVVVGAQDALGNPASLTGDVTISINTGPAGAALTGTTTVTAASGVATFGNLLLDKTGTYTLRAQATGLGAVNSAPFDVTTGLSRQAVFVTHPSDVVAGAAISPAVVVEVQDLQGNTDATFNGNVGIAIRINAGGGTLSGTDTVTAASGVATFPDLSIDKSGVGYTLGAGASGVAEGVSNSFTVSPGAASQLAFVVPPTTVGVGAPLAPVVVGVEDAFGNLVTSASDSIDLRIGVNPGSATLGGTTGLNAVNGLATFSDLTLSQAGSGYTLVAGSGTLVPATSPPFDVLAGATQFLVQVTPATQTAGQPVDIQVTAQDGLGNTVTSYRGTILFSTSDAQGSVPAPYTFTAGDNGSRLFPAGATLKTAGFPYVFVTDQANSSINGFANVTINPDVPFQLAFTQQPTDVVVGAAITPAVEVAIQDQFGNVVPNAGNSVQLIFGANPGNGVLSGGGPIGPSGGIVTFPAVSIDKAGSGYTLQAAATTGGLNSAASASFDVLPAGAVITWTGEFNGDWNNAINWLPSQVPGVSDNVRITVAANEPALGSNVIIQSLTLDTGATLAASGFKLTVFGDLSAPSGINTPGTVELAGVSKTVSGYVPDLLVSGVYTVVSSLTVIGNLDLIGTAALDLGTSTSVLVSGNFTTAGSTVIVMTGGGLLSVQGSAHFGGGGEAGNLTDGTLQVFGDFTQDGDPESFAASGNFYTVLASSTTQTVSFANPGFGAGTSHFAHFQVANNTAGVSLASAVFSDGQFYGVGGGGTQVKILGNGHALTTKGLICDSLIIDNMPLVVDTSSIQGLFFNHVVFQSFSPAAIQFSLTRTNETVTFDQVSFLSTANPSAGGRYLVINDPLFADGPFTLTMSNATPPSQQTAGTVTVSGQAILSWP